MGVRGLTLSIMEAEARSMTRVEPPPLQGFHVYSWGEMGLRGLEGCTVYKQNTQAVKHKAGQAPKGIYNMIGQVVSILTVS